MNLQPSVKCCDF